MSRLLVSRLLVDTSAYSAWVRGYPPVQASMQQASGLCLSVIVLGELLAGFAGGARRKQNEDYLRSFVSSPRVEVLPIDQETAIPYAGIQQGLRRRGTPISSNDLWLAATAYQHGLRVLTLDRDFLKILGVRRASLIERGLEAVLENQLAGLGRGDAAGRR